jgi:hypothetical protein
MSIIENKNDYNKAKEAFDPITSKKLELNNDFNTPEKILTFINRYKRRYYTFKTFFHISLGLIILLSILFLSNLSSIINNKTYIQILWYLLSIAILYIGNEYCKVMKLSSEMLWGIGYSEYERMIEEEKKADN